MLTELKELKELKERGVVSTLASKNILRPVVKMDKYPADIASG